MWQESPPPPGPLPGRRWRGWKGRAAREAEVHTGRGLLSTQACKRPRKPSGPAAPAGRGPGRPASLAPDGFAGTDGFFGCPGRLCAWGASGRSTPGEKPQGRVHFAHSLEAETAVPLPGGLEYPPLERQSNDHAEDHRRHEVGMDEERQHCTDNRASGGPLDGTQGITTFFFEILYKRYPPGNCNGQGKSVALFPLETVGPGLFRGIILDGKLYKCATGKVFLPFCFINEGNMFLR